MEVDIEKLALEMSSDLHNDFIEAGIKYQKKGMPLHIFVKMIIAQVFSLSMQMCDKPEQLTEIINDILVDGIDNLEDKYREKFQKFKRITVFCEPE